MRGYFLSIEGTDGSGKSSVANLLKEELEKNGFEVILTREPGGSKIGEQIRDILLSKENSELSKKCEALLYASSRAQHVDEVIRPNLLDGKVVISDRYVFSSLAYQGYSRELGIEDVMNINKFAMGDVYPDRILFFDIEPEVSIKRRFNDSVADRIEQEGVLFQNKVYNGYMESIKLYPENVSIIDARLTIDEVFNRCMEIIRGDLDEALSSNNSR